MTDEVFNNVNGSIKNNIDQVPIDDNDANMDWEDH